MKAEHPGWRGRGKALGSLLKEAWGEYERDYAAFLASAMIYYALVSLVPLLLLLFATLGLLLRFSDLAAAAEQQVLGALGPKFGTELPAMLAKLLDQLEAGSIVATVVSVVGLLLTASVLFRKLRLSFRAIWKWEPPLVAGSVRAVVRTTFLEQMISYLMVLTGGLFLIVSLALIAVLQWLSGLVSNLPLVADTTGWLLAMPIPLIFVTATFALLFKFLPPTPLRWRQVALASVLCAVAWFITAEVMTLYVLHFGTSLSAYGALGSALVIMLWLNVVSQLLFFGAELCKVVATRETKRVQAAPSSA